VRVFLDTNVLASAFATRGLCADVLRLVLMEHVLLTGEVNLVELRRVLRQRMKVPAETVDQIVSLLRRHVVVPHPAEILAVPVRDRDDAWVLASAVAGGADVLITGDKDLLEIEDRVPVRILTPRAFWDLVRRRKRSRQ
jgi:putative PIN family toxin of toxin-antitoxin system